MSHFERAFYDLTPHRRDAEAAREFDLAAVEFERELAANPASVVAHRYLARIQAVRKNYLEAARHYDRVSELLPLDVDACVFAAQAYVDAGRIEEARARLTAAQARTSRDEGEEDDLLIHPHPHLPPSKGEGNILGEISLATQ